MAKLSFTACITVHCDGVLYFHRRCQMTTDRWFTPEGLVVKARKVLGPIDLDPASEPEANTLIGAKRIITREQDGLKTSWGHSPSTVFLNPPGGELHGDPVARLFWERLLEYRAHSLLRHAIFIAFNISALRTFQSSPCAIQDFTFCVPQSRIKFRPSDGGASDAPRNDSVIVYVPGCWDYSDVFEAHFCDIGRISKPF